MIIRQLSMHINLSAIGCGNSTISRPSRCRGGLVSSSGESMLSRLPVISICQVSDMRQQLLMACPSVMNASGMCDNAAAAAPSKALLMGLPSYGRAVAASQLQACVLVFQPPKHRPLWAPGQGLVPHAACTLWCNTLPNACFTKEPRSNTTDGAGQNNSGGGGSGAAGAAGQR